MNTQSSTPIQRAKTETLYDLFKSRVDATPHDAAYVYFNKRTGAWVEMNWVETFRLFTHVRNALASEKLQIGDRILLVLPNSVEWVVIEQAAQHLGIVVVAMATAESAANINHIIDDTDASLVFINTDIYRETIQSHIFLHHPKTRLISLSEQADNSETTCFTRWIAKNRRFSAQTPQINKHALATIIYTSGTVGTPKGVMLTHNSLLNNAFACLERVNITSDDKLLSIIPVSHILERVAGYYAPMIAGASVSFSRGTGSTLHDLQQTNASILVATPHAMNLAFNQLLTKHPFLGKTIKQYLAYQNGLDEYRVKFIAWPLIRKLLSRTIKKQLLGRLRQIFCGGSALSSDIISIARLLNVPLFQGYGSTEAGGIISVNSPNQQQAESVGKTLNNANVFLNEQHELIIENNSLMLGYWRNKALSKQTLINGKLHTDDLARIDNSYIYLTGRTSEQLQLSTGKKVSPKPMEDKICADNLFENVSLYGENREKLTLVCQLCSDNWDKFIKTNHATNHLTESRKHALLSVRINTLLKTLPDHHFIDFIIPTFDSWNIENGLLSEDGKVNKANVEAFYAGELARVYGGEYIR